MGEFQGREPGAGLVIKEAHCWRYTIRSRYGVVFKINKVRYGSSLPSCAFLSAFLTVWIAPSTNPFDWVKWGLEVTCLEDLETLSSVFGPIVRVEFFRYTMAGKDFLYFVNNT